MRLAASLLVALTAVALVACGGGDDETAAPVPLAQRFVRAEDAPGSKRDFVEKRETTVSFDEFIGALRERAIDPDQEEMVKVFREAGFKRAGADARYFGETHSRTGRHVFSSFIELESEDGATSALDWLETDSQKPCPESCAAQVSSFDVNDIPDARGVHRIATAEAIERLGTGDQHPFDSYWVGFTEGPSVYTVDLQGPPGSVSEEEAQKIARAYHDRLTGD